MKKIAVITTTRAEYGQLEPVINSLREYESEGFIVELIVSGTHLSETHGMTIDDIRANDVRIDEILKVRTDSNSARDISLNQADVLTKFTDLFLKKKYNAVMILGDRYEMLAVSMAAVNTCAPIFHLCGGDTTEGAIDECIRHSISKMSYLHFVTNEESRRRVIQLGEAPERVFNYGFTGIDNIVNLQRMSKQEALESLGMKDCKYALCTYHPVTLEYSDVFEEVRCLIDVVKTFPDIEFIFTKANADRDGQIINGELEKEEKNVRNLHLFSSLGQKRYLSLLAETEFVMGNSSSGITEAPAFSKITINIGNRQRGRLFANSVVSVDMDYKAICNAVSFAVSEEGNELAKKAVNPYGDGKAASRIAQKAFEVLQGSIDLKKSFYNLEVEKEK